MLIEEIDAVGPASTAFATSVYYPEETECYWNLVWTGYDWELQLVCY